MLEAEVEVIERANKSFTHRLGDSLCSIGRDCRVLAGVTHHSLSASGRHLLCSQLGKVLSLVVVQSLVWRIH